MKRFRDEALIALRNEFFSRSDIPAIPFLITPILVHRPHFPLVRYIELFNFNSILNRNLSIDRKGKLYQLHAVLTMIENRLNQLPPSLNKQIVAIIRYFIHGLLPSNDIHRYPGNEQDDHDQDDRMDIETGEIVCVFVRFQLDLDK